MDLLDGPTVRRTDRGGRTWYAAIDLVAELTGDADPAARLAVLRQRHPAWAGRGRTLDFDGTRLVGVTLADALKLAQALPTPAARRFLPWIASAAAAWAEAAADDDLIALRARRRQYAGRDASWVEHRSAAVAARRALTAEWAARGATGGDDYRRLTNELARHGFGGDVATLRADRDLTGRPAASLRDHLTDVELLLTAAAEAAAVALMRRRDSRGMDELLRAARDAGEAVAAARRRLAA